MNRVILRVMLLAVVGLVGVIGCDDDDQFADSYRVTGTVTDSVTALPIDSAIVTWSDTLALPEGTPGIVRGTGRILATTPPEQLAVWTDSMGAYDLVVPETSARLFVLKEGYATEIIELGKLSGRRDSVDAALAPE